MKFAGLFAKYNEADAAALAKHYSGTPKGVFLAAHDAEIMSKKAKVYNYGWVISETGICSKTNKGILETDGRTSVIVHKWHLD